MATEADKAELKAVFELAKEQFDAAYEAQHERRRESLEDRRFHSVAGAQWEGDLAEQFANKMQLEVNKCHLAVIRIFSEYRNNPITVDFVSRDNSDIDDLASTCDGLYRATEQDSQAREAYDNAFDEGVGGGFGAWRLTADYVDEYDPENEQQKILLEPIFDADQSVYFDVNAKRQDKADARHAFIITAMTREAFEDEYGETEISSWQQAEGGFEWATPDYVYVAEYFVVEEVTKELILYRGVDGKEFTHTSDDFEEDKELRARLKAQGSVRGRKRKIKERKVRKYFMSGAEVLEDVGHIAGMHIPIVPFYAKRWYIQGNEHFCGHIRHAKDMTRLENMQTSQLAELSARSPASKPIFTPEQIQGHADLWAQDAVEDWAYLLINSVTDNQGNAINGPVGYTKSPEVPPAMAALLQVASQHLQELLGSPQNAEEIQPNTSGKAVELVQNKLDMQSFIYMDNMSKSVQRSGQIWLSMAKDVYVEDGRRERVISATGESAFADLNGREIIDDESGEKITSNDLSRAKFEVAVDVGPNSSSKRAAVVRAITAMMGMTQDPQTMQILQSMAMMNMEGEGLKDIREFYRKKLVSLGVLEPTEQDKKRVAAEQENAAPDPNVNLMNATAAEAESAAVLKQAQTQKVIAEVAETEADTQKTLAETRQAGAVGAERIASPPAARPTAQPI